MSIFRQQQNAPLTERGQLEAKYNVARTSLLLIVILTSVNMFLLLIQDFSYFLFSASIPYLLVDIGMTFCGKYPPEYYTDGLEGIVFVGDGLLIALSVAAFLIVGVYLALWYFSRRHKACLVAALVLFSVDTLFLFTILTPSISGLLDILFHGLFIYELIVGLRAKRTLANLPPEDVTDVPFTDVTDEPTLFETVMTDNEPETSTNGTSEAAETKEAPAETTEEPIEGTPEETREDPSDKTEE